MPNPLPLRFAGALLVVHALGGCADGPPRLPEPQCKAAGAVAELGKTADDKVVDDARYAAGAMRTRVIRPGQVVTMEVDPQRLNIEVDEAGRIRRLRCG